jgi:hypothetical protein
MVRTKPFRRLSIWILVMRSHGFGFRDLKERSVGPLRPLLHWTLHWFTPPETFLRGSNVGRFGQIVASGTEQCVISNVR